VQVQQDLKTIVETMNGYTNNVNTKIEFLTKVLVKLIRNQENSHQSYSQAIADKLDESIKPNVQYFVEMRSDLSQVIKILQEQNNQTIHSDLSQLIKLLQAQDNQTIHSDLSQLIKLLQAQDNQTIHSDLSQLIKLLQAQNNRTPNKKKFKFWGL
jgi:HPt (histidine-containing phosphotransfer) domain-containing protein